MCKVKCVFGLRCKDEVLSGGSEEPRAPYIYMICMTKPMQVTSITRACHVLCSAWMSCAYRAWMSCVCKACLSGVYTMRIWY